MPTLNISLPDSVTRFVEEQVSTGAYRSASEYLRQLVRADQKRQAKRELEDILIESLNSGDPISVTPSMIEDVRQRLRARAAERNTASH